MRATLALAVVMILAALPAWSQSAQPLRPAGPPACSTKPEATVCRVERPLSQAQAEARLGGKAFAWWADGDILSVIARRDGDDAQLCCAIQGPLERVAASNLWTAAYRIRDLNQAIIDFSVFPSLGARQSIQVWRGPDAPSAPEMTAVDDLLSPPKFAGRLEHITVESRSLNAPRGLTIYVPPRFDAARRYSVVYMADGMSVTEVARILEPLILKKTVRPTVMIGLDSLPDPQRARDYLVGYDDTGGFARHDAFLIDEVLPLAETKYGASADPRERLTLGFSNGAAWAVETAMRHPDLFANAAGLSFGWSQNSAPRDIAQRPRLFLAAGTLESAFLKITTAYAERAEGAGYQVKLVTPVSGHTPFMWDVLYPQVFEWAFPARDAP